MATFGSDESIRKLKQLYLNKKENEEEICVFLKGFIEQKCRHIAYSEDPGWTGSKRESSQGKSLGYSRYYSISKQDQISKIIPDSDLEMNMDTFCLEALWEVYQNLDSFLADPRNDPDVPREDSFSELQRESWFKFNVLTGMKRARKLDYGKEWLLDRIDFGENDNALDNGVYSPDYCPVTEPNSEDNASPVSFPHRKQGVKVSVDTEPDFVRKHDTADRIAWAISLFGKGNFDLDTSLSVLYLIVAQFNNQKLKVDDCVCDMNGSTRQEIFDGIHSLVDETDLISLSKDTVHMALDDLLKQYKGRNNMNQEARVPTVRTITTGKSRLIGKILKLASEGDNNYV